ncbi:MAG: glycosyltransferase family 4 protein [Cyclobacteriaceae bacterium]|nr:glycosyltransferase family 4 protein [Cyclobacteriaceae bacterium]
MRKVAIVFDNFGNPNQPFLKEWFFRINNQKSIAIKGFTDKFCFSRETGIVVLKAGRTEKYFRYLLKMLNPVLKNVNWQLVPVVQFAPDVIHILNAQQVDQYQPILENHKTVFSFRGFETSVRPQQDSAWSEKLKSIYSKATALHFVSDFLKEEAVKLGAPEEKCVVIRRSVDTGFFKPKAGKKEGQAIHFIAVGRLTWQKGYSILLQAFAGIVKTNPNTKLTIIGDGPDGAAIAKEIESLDLNKNVKQIPHLDRKALRESLWKADIFVQASLSDALPNSVLEASACGLPVVSTEAGGIPEAVRHEKTGILVEPGDVELLLTAMIRLMNDFNLRKKLGDNGRQFIVENFSAEQESKKWEAFYLTL